MPEKKYTPEGLEILDDALETIRRRPDVYLPSGELRGDALSARLVDDIACVCTLAVAVLQHDQWWIVACEEDWVDMNYRRWLERRQRAKLPSIDGGIESYFVNLVPFPERRANYFHGEVLLAAFAEAVLTATAHGSPTCLIGSMPGEDLLSSTSRSLPYWRRLVAFRLPG